MPKAELRKRTRECSRRRTGGVESESARFAACMFFIVIFNFVQGYPSYGFHAMFWAFVAAEAYPKYRFTGNKGFLASTVAGTLASAASLGSFVISVLR